MKRYSVLLCITGCLLNSAHISASETRQQKVESLEVRVNAVEKKTRAVVKKVEDIGTKLDQLLQVFQEKFGEADEKKAVDGKEVVIVTGGIGFYGYVSAETGSVARSAELYIPETGKTCFFKDLPDKRDGHTMDTVNNTAVLCGEGKGKYTNCLQYTPTSPEGAWTGYGRTEGGTLQHHSSWVSRAGLVLLGGSIFNYVRGATALSGRTKTTEIVPGGGRSFDLESDSRDSCAIQLDDYFILTGGFFTGIRKQVAQYNLQGYVKNLPDLNDGRYGHGCGTYKANGNTVMIVAGGGHSLTETMVMGDAAWKTVNPLPQGLRNMAFVSMGDYFLILGGENDNNAVTAIYKFDGSNWTEAGKLNAPRYGTAATVVRSNELAELCK